MEQQSLQNGNMKQYVTRLELLLALVITLLIFKGDAWPPAIPPPANSIVTSIVSSASSVVILPVSLARKQFIICNNSTSLLFLSTQNPANSTTNFFTSINSRGSGGSGGQYVFCFEQTSAVYTGAIYGIWASANGNAVATEDR